MNENVDLHFHAIEEITWSWLTLQNRVMWNINEDSILKVSEKQSISVLFIVLSYQIRRTNLNIL